MAGLADHLSKLLFTAHGARAKRAPSPRQMWGRAHTRLGSWRAVAQAFNVSESTLRRWRRGEAKPSPAKVEGMRSWDTASRMRRGALSDDTVRMVWEFDGRQRTVHADQLRLAPGTLEAVRDQWIAKGQDAAVQLFVNRVGDLWYRQKLAGWDAREVKLAQIKESPAGLTEDEQETWGKVVGDIDEEDLESAWDDEEWEEYGGAYDELTGDEVIGEEAQDEISEYDMTVHHL